MPKQIWPAVQVRVREYLYRGCLSHRSIAHICKVSPTYVDEIKKRMELDKKIELGLK